MNEMQVEWVYTYRHRYDTFLSKTGCPMPLEFKLITDENKTEVWIETSLTGKPLLSTPQLNKGTAFTAEEREVFGLIGKLPPQIETLEQQKQRCYRQFNQFEAELQKHIYLNGLHDTNQVLFYKLVLDHLEEIMPYIYTPHVGTAVKLYSREFRKPRGIFLNYENLPHFKSMLENRSNPDIDVIVVTDGEAVLGIGDQGIGSINIPIAKLMVYTLCAGINPARTLPIVLDVGTNNQELLNDPFYLGCRYPRLRGEKYDQLIDEFLKQIHAIFPKAFLHWEDFSAMTARMNLAKSSEIFCTFNDDIEGTGAVVVATILAALKGTQRKLQDQKIVIFGAGTAGAGIADQLNIALQMQGYPAEQARNLFWLIDKEGLIFEDTSSLKNFQRPYARSSQERSHYKKNHQGTVGLAEVVDQIGPSILIGCSSVSGAFNQHIVKSMTQKTAQPIILALSNPNSLAEAHPTDLLEWTEGQALIATGSPFGVVDFRGRLVRIAQCNNAFIFPGLGLGVVVSKAKHVTPTMLSAASQALSDFAPILSNPLGALLPEIKDARSVAKSIAFAVAKQAMCDHQAKMISDDELKARIENEMWSPQYLPLKLKKRGH